MNSSWLSFYNHTDSQLEVKYVSCAKRKDHKTMKFWEYILKSRLSHTFDKKEGKSKVVLKYSSPEENNNIWLRSLCSVSFSLSLSLPTNSLLQETQGLCFLFPIVVKCFTLHHILCHLLFYYFATVWSATGSASSFQVGLLMLGRVTDSLFFVHIHNLLGESEVLRVREVLGVENI